MALTNFANGRLWGRRHGKNDPWLLALHGWQRSHRDFDAMLEGLDAIALDLPGHGSAPAPEEALSTTDFAKWIEPVLKEMAPNPVIVGHSFGGRVAIRLAASDPTSVGAVILSGVPLLKLGGNRKPPVAFRMARSLNKIGVLSDERMESLRRKHGSSDYKRASGVMRDVLVKAVNEDYSDALTAWNGPLELVWGSEDDQAPLGIARSVVQMRPATRLHVLHGVGHFTPRDAVDDMREAIFRSHQLCQGQAGGER